MDDSPDDQETIKCATNRAWWTRAPLLVIWLPGQLHSSYFRWWLVDIFILIALVVVLYVGTHPPLSFSPSTITQR